MYRQVSENMCVTAFCWALTPQTQAQRRDVYWEGQAGHAPRMSGSWMNAYVIDM